MNIESVYQIIQLIVPSIKTAEDFIRGPGRGQEKKEAVLGDFARRIFELKKELGEIKGVDVSKYNWIKLALNGPEFLAKVGKVSDDIVDLANFLESFENDNQSGQSPPKPEVVN